MFIDSCLIELGMYLLIVVSNTNWSSPIIYHKEKEFQKYRSFNFDFHNLNLTIHLLVVSNTK